VVAEAAARVEAAAVFGEELVEDVALPVEVEAGVVDPPSGR
jgi:hypothetical protein